VLDVTLNRNGRGKFTFSWSAGDLRFDDKAVYPVFSTLWMPKGAYYWDSTGQQGTLLSTVKQDRMRTGSQLAAYGRDALEQCQGAKLLRAVDVSARRTRPGSYLVDLLWTGPSGDTVAETAEV